jgi:AhpC/TSA family.
VYLNIQALILKTFTQYEKCFQTICPLDFAIYTHCFALLCSTILYGLVKFDERYLNLNVDRKLELNNLVDTLGNKVNLNFETKVTIVNFWFRGCSACVNETRQFESLLKGRERQLSIYSVSIDEENYWRSLFAKSSDLPVLRARVKNWKHYAFDLPLSSPEKYLRRLYRVKGYPSCLVVDSKGTIIEVPSSAVEYIRENYCHKSWVTYFWTEKLFAKRLILLRVMLLPYTILFWLSVFISSRFRKRSARQNTGGEKS